PVAIPPPPTPTLFPYTTLFRSRLPKPRACPRPPSPPFSADGGPPASATRRAVASSKPPHGWVTTGPPHGARIRVASGSWSPRRRDRKSTRLNSSHLGISYAVFC